MKKSPIIPSEVLETPPPLEAYVTTGNTSQRGTVVISNIVKNSIDSFLGSSSDSKQSDEIGVLQASFATIKYDPHRTQGRAIFGDEFRPEVKLFFVFGVCFVFASVTSLLALWNFIPRVFIYSAILCWPLDIYALLIMNLDIAWHASRSTSAIINFFSALVCFISSIYYYRNQDHHSAVIHFMVKIFVSLNFTSYFDAFAPSVRIVWNRYFLPNFILTCVVYQIALKYNWSNCDNVLLPFFGDYMQVSAASQMSSCIANMIILLTVNGITSWRHPNKLVTVSSRAEAIILNQKEVQSWRALNSIAKDISSKHAASDVIQSFLTDFMSKQATKDPSSDSIV